MGLYITIMSILTFMAFGIDKYRAKTNAWRISEQTLLCLSAIGGGVGALIAMLVFRHKIRKPRFAIGVPVIVMIQIIYCIIINE